MSLQIAHRTKGVFRFESCSRNKCRTVLVMFGVGPLQARIIKVTRILRSRILATSYSLQYKAELLMQGIRTIDSPRTKFIAAVHSQKAPIRRGLLVTIM